MTEYNKQYNKKVKEYNKKVVILKDTILKLIQQNGTASYVIKKTGKSKQFVNVYLNRLIKKGLIKRVNKGVYEYNKKLIGTTPSLTTLKSTNDLFRLHSVEIKLNLSKDTFLTIKNTIFSDKVFFKLKQKIKGKYYFYLDVKGFIGKETVYILFPVGFEVFGETIPSVYAQLDLIINNILIKWGNTFKVELYKSGRVNYEICNQHIALIHNGVAQELSKEGISDKVRVYDDEDGKTAYMFDKSKGFDELETPHPTKAPIYAEEAKKFMNHVKRGEMEKLYDEHLDLKMIVKQNHLLLNILFHPDKLQKDEEKVDPSDKSYFG